MLRKGFAEDHVAVVTGEADITAAFARLPIDRLLFTGFTPIGKRVMRAAAEDLVIRRARLAANTTRNARSGHPGAAKHLTLFTSQDKVHTVSLRANCLPASMVN